MNYKAQPIDYTEPNIDLATLASSSRSTISSAPRNSNYSISLVATLLLHFYIWQCLACLSLKCRIHVPLGSSCRRFGVPDSLGGGISSNMYISTLSRQRCAQ
ncbi:hypothetical protein MSAN_01369600 [Mycena sanguinolenta]|uniref:Uncharacterized protein n=1 Tax=Mycena sanguinolenta TaxID=230812 RepID=A0A8H7CY45_9AGAR|nr:hypothetical protein MSAN_01369600 [Mycena sanguinolenta]